MQIPEQHCGACATGIHLGSIGIAAVYVGSLSGDGGRSTGVCYRKLAPNHFKRLLLRVMVVSVEVKVRTISPAGVVWGDERKRIHVDAS